MCSGKAGMWRRRERLYEALLGTDQQKGGLPTELFHGTRVGRHSGLGGVAPAH